MHPVRYLESRDFVTAADTLGVPVEVIRAVAAVEARNTGFIKGTDLPVMLFEGHHFHRYTNGRYAADYPSLSYPKWTRDHYKGGRGEYDRLVQAIRIHAGNPEPALLSSSWGMFQIMGFNHEKAGYETVADFVNAMASDEGLQLEAFVAFLTATGLAARLRDQAWAKFARGYNGAGYKANAYDTKLAAAFARERALQQERLAGGTVDIQRGDAVELQVALNAALGDSLPEKLATDGWIGEKTTLAIRLVQRSQGMADTGKVTPELLERLGIGHETHHEQAA
jgi:N-acetylmuramidase/Putative peptidoglycan binding domain